jgi:hypothetical protein
VIVIGFAATERDKRRSLESNSRASKDSKLGRIALDLRVVATMRFEAKDAMVRFFMAIDRNDRSPQARLEKSTFTDSIQAGIHAPPVVRQ